MLQTLEVTLVPKRAARSEGRGIAKFRCVRTIDSFEYDAQPSVEPKQISEPALQRWAANGAACYRDRPGRARAIGLWHPGAKPSNAATRLCSCRHRPAQPTAISDQPHSHAPSQTAAPSMHDESLRGGGAGGLRFRAAPRDGLRGRYPLDTALPCPQMDRLRLFEPCPARRVQEPARPREPSRGNRRAAPAQSHEQAPRTPAPQALSQKKRVSEPAPQPPPVAPAP